MPASLIARFDKCFAAAWLDQSRVVLGTKDNALVVMDVDARTCERVALPARREFRPPARRRRPRRFATRGVPDFYVGDVLTRRDSNPGGHALMHVETELVSNVADAPVYRFGDSPVRSLEGVSASPSTSAEVDFEFETDSDSDSDGSLRDSRRFENCGIHAISLNPSRTRLATGGENPCDVAVFSASLGDEASLSSDAPRRLLTPSALLVGHRDWVFGLDWITDNVLASGSRDATVRIWSVPDGGASGSPDRETKRGVSSGAIPEIREPVASIRAHADRVRDVRYARRARRLVSLSVDGTVAFTDPEVMAAIDTRRLRSRRELMCLATDGGDATAIGSQAHVALLDHRAKTNRACEKKLPHDDADGVRSLSFSGGGRLLTVGGGGGRLFFFDVVAGKFLPRVLGVDEEGGSLVARADGATRADGAKHASRTGPEDSPGVRDARRVHGDDVIAPPSARPPHDGARRRSAASLVLRTGEGFLDREHDMFLEHFADAEDWFAARNACYAHAWDASGTRLLVAGGPLAYGLKGCYVGLWR